MASSDKKLPHRGLGGFTLQHDQRDCGVACLLSLVRYYGGNSTFEHIRRLCGADLHGTTLLGLKEAANQLGFEAEGYESDVQSLIEHGEPTILHVELEGGLQHYVVWYSPARRTVPAPEGGVIEAPFGGLGAGLHFIGDPARGVVEWTEEELRSRWKSGTCLVLKPTEAFVTATDWRKAQREWFLGVLRQDMPLLAVTAGIGVLIAALGLAMSVYSQQLIDKILPSKNADKIILSTVLVVVLLLGRVGLSVLRQFLLLRQSKEFGVRLNAAFYEPLLQLPKSFFDTRKIGDFVARLNDTQRIQHTVSVLAGNLLVDLLMVLVAFGILFYYEWRIGLLSLLLLPVYFWLIYRQNKKIIEAQTNVMVSYSLSESNYINTIQGIADVKNKNKQGFFSDLNRLLYGNFQEMVYRSGVVQTRLSASAGVASVLFISLILAITIFQVQQNQLKIGEMTAILGIISTLLPSVTSLALVSVPFNEAKVAFNRMYEFASPSPARRTVPTRAAYRPDGGVFVEKFSKIELRNIMFRFAGKRPLLHNINLSLQRGEIVSIVGESGGGKSMICQLIQKFYEPESGQILINDSTQLSDIEATEWRNMIGVVPQHVHIFNGTVVDNVCFGTTQREIETAFKLLEDYGFSPIFEKLPQGLFTILGEEGVNLSGGQRQLIGLARALCSKPQLLILDEATAALDRHTERFVLDLLLRLKAEMGILLITHRLHTLRNICDRIYLLENGTFTHAGAHSALLESSNMYSDYWQEWTT
ncbi:MAG: peptidase domain-containing ABC transporter [Runella slithyformis]|nr:MAG: peptidase domain-containing ABC transporter [Runella slithyformis]